MQTLNAPTDSRLQTKIKVKNPTLWDNEYLEMKTIYRRSFEETRQEKFTLIILSFFLVNLFVNSWKDTKLSKHLVYLERKD